MAKTNPPPASNQDGWIQPPIEFEPGELVRELAKIPPAELRQLLAKAGLLEQPQDDGKTQIGRPPESPELDILIKFYLANKKALRLTDESFKAMVKEMYRQTGEKGPSPKTMERRIQAARRAK
jgi:hypothetical protein